MNNSLANLKLINLNKSCINVTNCTKQLEASVSNDIFSVDKPNMGGLSLGDLHDSTLKIEQLNEPNKVTTTITTTITTVFKPKNGDSIPFIITKAASPTGSNYFVNNSFGKRFGRFKTIWVYITIRTTSNYQNRNYQNKKYQNRNYQK